MEISSLGSVPPLAPDTIEIGAAHATTVHVVAWSDPGLERIGVDPRSWYVERFWLPALGPSTTWLLRRLADRLDKDPDGFDLDLDETARELGLGTSDSRHSPLRRAIDRCVRYGVARRDGVGVLAVRRSVPLIPKRQLLKLPPALQEQHRGWAASETGPDEGVRLRRRARLVALDLRDLGVDDACIERHLLKRGVHPATAFEAARWAWSPAAEVDLPSGTAGA